MTRILLIRHGNTDLVDVKLCGRMPGISLNEEGRRQAQAVGRRLHGRVTLQAIYTSPLERAAETAAEIAALQNLAVVTDQRLLEVEFGQWTGLTFRELDALESWHRYHVNRSLHTAPGGESLLQVQARVWASLSEVIVRHPEQTVALVTHSDVIRALLVLLLGMPLDQLLRLEIAPASISELLLGGDYPIVTSMNVLASY